MSTSEWLLIAAAITSVAWVAVLIAALRDIYDDKEEDIKDTDKRASRALETM